MNRMLRPIVSVAGMALMLLAGGCSKTADNSLNYKSAINDYYAAHPACLWSTPQKFPVQVDASNVDETRGYDALFNQGLLTRTTGEKKKLLVMSKQVTNYDVTDKGRGAWTVDKTEPSFGNFCYGSRTVSSIDSSTPTTGQVGATTQVTYHWTFGHAADWAKAAEVQNSFPSVQTNVAGGGVATKTLVDTNAGWKVQAREAPGSSTTVD